MRRKKDLGKFLNKKKSWNKIIGYLKKYLHKYGSWQFTYEFDKGEVHINIVSTDGDKLPKHKDRPLEANAGGAETKIKRHKRKKNWM